MTENRALKVVLMGDTKVGKTSIVNRFIHGTFDEEVRESFGASFWTKIVNYKELDYKL